MVARGHQYNLTLEDIVEHLQRRRNDDPAEENKNDRRD
jgi:hypothetical protein